MTQVSREKPVRTCLGCGKKTVKQELFRLVVVNGIIVSDAGFCMKGRGAYVCRQIVCWHRFQKNEKKIARAFRRKNLVFSDEIKIV